MSEHGSRVSVRLPDRLAGAVWGHLVGDALGVPYEFRSPDEIGAVRYGERGSHGQQPGTWSDDGALMLALLDSLLGEPEPGRTHPTLRFDTDDQGRRALAWWRDGAYTPDGDGRFDWGFTTERAMDALAEGVPGERAGPRGERDCGNGSLMRILPLALAFRDPVATPDAELVSMAIQASAVTHGHPRAAVTCALYSIAVRRLLAGEPDRAAVLEASARAVRVALREPTVGAEVAGGEPAALEGALDELLAWPDRSGQGFVLDSFWSAWDAFAGAAGYPETVERAVAYGHDTDTTAAIAGGLAGAYWGLGGPAGIPPTWLDAMRGRTIVAQLVDRLIALGPWRTSTTHPIRMDEVDLAAVPGFADAAAGGGRLGMTLLPGKRIPGWTGDHWRDLDADIDRLRDVHGVDAYLLLVEDHELLTSGVPDLVAKAEARGVEVLRHPVPDLDVPADPTAFAVTLDAVGDRLRRGRTVVVTCRGGLGRTGTAVACLLVDGGLDADEAIRRTRAARPDTIEQVAQEAFVRAWSHRRSAARGPGGGSGRISTSGSTPGAGD